MLFKQRISFNMTLINILFPVSVETSSAKKVKSLAVIWCKLPTKESSVAPEDYKFADQFMAIISIHGFRVRAACSLAVGTFAYFCTQWRRPLTDRFKYTVRVFFWCMLFSATCRGEYLWKFQSAAKIQKGFKILPTGSMYPYLFGSSLKAGVNQHGRCWSLRRG